jgi:hypothetical protein
LAPIRVHSWLNFFFLNAEVLFMSDSSSKLLAALFAERRVLTVTEATEQIKDALES